MDASSPDAPPQQDPQAQERVMIREGKDRHLAGRVVSATETDVVVDLGGRQVTLSPKQLKAME